MFHARRAGRPQTDTCAHGGHAPGKRTLSQQLPSRAAADSAVQAAPASRPRATDVSAAFDWSDAEPGRVAAAGVASASAPLPYGEQIQASFGRHDVSGVRVATDGAAQSASAALGAEAYATGDRIAFAGTPDLRLAAHEAAHTVQQRGGVQLSDGVGRSGDRYEQHADRVAELVVAGRSAEAVLDEHAGAGGGGGGGAVQRFDSPHHVEVGDSVKGPDVTVVSTDGKAVVFTAGEVAALVDYVGDATNLKQYTSTQLNQMKQLLADGCEEALAWDTVTDGNYSRESQANEKHFAPGGGAHGGDFASQFQNHYGMALSAAFMARRGGAVDADQLAEGRLELYTAEHYLLDAFSAGHQLAAVDVERVVTEFLGSGDVLRLTPPIASRVWDDAADVIRGYSAFGVTGYAPIDARYKFMELAVAGGVLKGAGGMVDGMRKFVHEQLESGVEVTSPAHPEPWTLVGDHGLAEADAADRETNVAVMQAALAEVRGVFEGTAPEPRGNGPWAIAKVVFDRHRPVPTAKGQRTVADAIASGVRTEETFVVAIADAMSGTIEGVMDYLVYNSRGMIRKDHRPAGADPARPDIPHADDGTSEAGGGAISDGGPATAPHAISESTSMPTSIE